VEVDDERLRSARWGRAAVSLRAHFIADTKFVLFEGALRRNDSAAVRSSGEVVFVRITDHFPRIAAQPDQSG
jgi:hypothetical protein